ncbi:MAG TPA: aromatic amino acid hydroxylase [Polyangiales bacterium]|nr:aromatic amino acid hydroxylase [Polyangiales bacterium]
MPDAALEVPPHLRHHVVQQDYAQYDEIDQAVWRFVLLQTHARSLRTAHPAFARGFEAAGITVERIPRIAQMSQRLAEHGWRAVCVDGFIPPRAFSAFQARGVLPIAADMRTREHLAYTPAPDIIHEAAGHAPFLAQPEFARYLRRIGAVAERAFSVKKDREVYAAIYTLSEVKENPATTPEQLARAEQALQAALAIEGEPSEAAKVARLYWWTVEYGLCGTPSDYRLYGAGLLSSLGEGHFCHEPRVKKLPLTAACIETDYDITREQPQLFVAESFAQLEPVLDEVTATLAQQRGGLYGLQLAQQSEELATLTLGSGFQVCGVVSRVHAEHDAVAWVELSGECAFGRDDAESDLPRTQGYLLPLLAVEQSFTLRDGEHIDLVCAGGVQVSGRVQRVLGKPGQAGCVILDGCEIRDRERMLLRSATPYPLLLGDRVLRAHAGALDGYHASTAFSGLSVPRPRSFDAAHRELLVLYERALEAWRTLGGAQLTAAFEDLTRTLDARYPDDWLLRWNLLEDLYKVGSGSLPLADSLRTQLERLELRFQEREPIATGLRYLRERATEQTKRGAA